jgi:hypothetical protein
MKMFWAVFLLGCLAAWAGDGAFIIVGEEHRYPTSWTRPVFIIQNGVVTYIPSVPQDWETVMVGFELRVESVTVKGFLIDHELAAIGADTKVSGSGGKPILLAKGKTARIGGQAFEPLGILGRRVYLRHVRTGKLCSVPISD